MKFYDGFIGHEPESYLNSRGHRSKEIEELNLRNYILFAGDNVAVDFSKPVEDTYPYIVSQLLGADYYNLAIFNGGIDSLKINLITWFTKIKEPPKAIVVSCEFLDSFLVTNQNFSQWQTCDLSNQSVVDALHYGNHNGYWNGRTELTNKLIRNLIRSPIYQIEFNNKKTAFTENVVNIPHTGEMFDHKSIATTVASEIKQRTKRARP